MYYTLSKICWSFLAPGNALLLLCAVMTCWTWARHRSVPSGIAGMTCLGICIINFSPVGLWMLHDLERRVTVEAIDEPPYGIIALGGGADARLQPLVDLSRKYSTARVVYSGRESWNVPARFAELGGDPERLVLDSGSRNTHESALAMARLFGGDRREKWLLVTSAFHMPRARSTFQKMGFSVLPFPVDFSPGSFEAGRDAVMTVNLASKEWLGSFVYGVSGMSDSVIP